MAYEKQNFINGTVLDADHLNKIEDQILLNSNHNHNGVYAEVDHVHNDYSNKSHVHSGYATSEHNHDISDININKEARYAMSFFGVNPLSNNIEGATIDDDTPENWINFGTGYAYIGATDRALMKNFPIGYSCYLHNYVHDTYIYQIIYPLTTSGTICHRCGSANNGWYDEGRWRIEQSKAPKLTDEQKMQMQNLIDQYMRVKNTLFDYTGSVRRESYAYTDYGSRTYYAYNTPNFPIHKHKDTEVGSDTYYKYMLNCGVFCQMIWMGRPISDFLTGTTTAEKMLLSYAEGKEIDDSGEPKTSSKTEALTSCPAVTTAINSVFTNTDGTCWGYYFTFDLSQRAYGAANSSGELYKYNSYFNYDSTPTVVELETVDFDTHTTEKVAGNINAYFLTNQVIANCHFDLTVKEGQTISAGSTIHLGTIVKQLDVQGKTRHYAPTLRTPLTIHSTGKMFAGYIGSNGGIYIRCDKDLTANTYTIAINTSYIPSSNVESNGVTYPLGFDGASNMAEELYALGYEVPYSEIDIGDLVFFRSADISDDFRNILSRSDDDATVNRAFRHISHVGVVYDFDKSGYPIIADCTSSYTHPVVLGKTHIAGTNNFSQSKASYERNNTVMVARHPAAFGTISLKHQVPTEFTPYRGILNDSDIWVGGNPD